jgi:hypothetical protein
MAFSMMSMCIATLLRTSSWAFPILQPLRTRPGPDGLPGGAGATVPLLAAGQAGATFPGGNGKIAFASYRDGDRDGLDGDWEVREGVADDFFAHFSGPAPAWRTSSSTRCRGRWAMARRARPASAPGVSWTASWAPPPPDAVGG